MRQLYAYVANNANESTRGLFEDGMSKGLTKTHTALGFSVLYHVFARKQLILCFALRYKSYLTLLYYVPSITDFFSALELSRTALLGCRLLFGNYWGVTGQENRSLLVGFVK